MGDEHKTKEQLINELVGMRQRITQLETSKAEHQRQEEELRASEAKFRNLFEHAKDAIFLADTQSGIIIDANPAACNMLGLPKEKVVGMHQSQLHPQEEVEHYRQLFRDHAKKGIANAEDLFVQRSDGNRVPIDISASVAELAGKSIIQGVFRDITERKRAEKALQEHGERYRLLAENAADVIWTMDMNLQYTYISPSITPMLGYCVEEAMTKTVEESLTPASMDVAMKTLAVELASENAGQEDLFEPVTVELELNHKDGSTVWSEVKATFLRDPDGQPVGFLGITRDITERKRAEDALKQSEEKYRTLVNEINDCIFVVDVEGIISFANNAAAKAFGFESPQELIGRNISELRPPEVREEMKKMREKAIKTGEFHRLLEFPFIRKEGSTGFFELNPNPIIENGRIIGTRDVIRDITERKRAEEALQRSEEKYRLLVDRANEAIIVIQDRTIRFVNSKATELLGYSKDEFASRPFTGFMHPDDREIAVKRHLSVLRGEELSPAYYLYRFIDKNGNTKWMETTGALITWEERPATLVLMNDITERKRAEDALRESEEKYRQFIENAQEGVWAIPRPLL
jgi:PAS domain S-box-containing protein